MKLLPFFCVVFTLLQYLSAADDEFSKCDPKCVFEERTITSKNIGSFPKCAKVCAFLLIDDTSGVTEKQLNTAFKNMKTLIGGLEIYDTNYKSASFLAGLQRMESATMGITINGNNEMLELGWKNLTTLMVYYLDVYGNDKLKKLNLPKWKTFSCIGATCTTTGIINNYAEPKFCFSINEAKMLSSPKVFLPMISGKICAPKASNKKVCTKPTAGCQELIGNLNINAKFDVKKVKALKFLYGSLIVKGTNFTNLNFLGNLTRIVQLSQLKTAVEIQNNKQLKAVKLPKLTRILTTQWDSLQIKNNHKSMMTDSKSCYALRAAMVPDGSWTDMPHFDGLTCEQVENPGKATTKKASGGIS